MLGDLLYAAVQVADDALGVHYPLAVQLELHAEHPVGRRVLRAHIQNDFVGSQDGGADARRSFDVGIGHLARYRVRDFTVLLPALDSQVFAYPVLILLQDVVVLA